MTRLINAASCDRSLSSDPARAVQPALLHAGRRSALRAGVLGAGWLGLCGLGLGGLGLLGGCASGLLPKPAAEATLLVLDSDTAPAPTGAAPAPASGATLIVETPRAAAGCDSRDFAYVRRANEVAYYAQHLWLDTPARMLAPLMTQALQRSGAFRAVAPASSSAAGELRLESDLLRLQHDHTRSPSQLRLTLRARLIDTATRRVLGTRDFDISVVAPTEDPRGGAQAANLAVQQLLTGLVQFSANTATQAAAPTVKR